MAEIGGKFFYNNCRNGIAENGGKKSGSEIWGRVKKKSVMSIIYLQLFHNKSYVISYY